MTPPLIMSAACEVWRMYLIASPLDSAICSAARAWSLSARASASQGSTCAGEYLAWQSRFLRLGWLSLRSGEKRSSRSRA